MTGIRSRLDRLERSFGDQGRCNHALLLSHAEGEPEPEPPAVCPTCGARDYPITVITEQVVPGRELGIET